MLVTQHKIYSMYDESTVVVAEDKSKTNICIESIQHIHY